LNHFILTATLIAKEALRYTPAGLPVVQCQLEHCGEVIEDQQVRRIQMSLTAIAIGTIARQLEQWPLGEQRQCEGFMAPQSQRSQRLVFHITNLNT